MPNAIASYMPVYHIGIGMIDAGGGVGWYEMIKDCV